MLANKGVKRGRRDSEAKTARTKLGVAIEKYPVKSNLNDPPGQFIKLSQLSHEEILNYSNWGKNQQGYKAGGNYEDNPDLD